MEFKRRYEIGIENYILELKDGEKIAMTNLNWVSRAVLSTKHFYLLSHLIFTGNVWSMY